jgi:uncharacterized membrane protein (DUF106 family)
MSTTFRNQLLFAVVATIIIFLFAYIPYGDLYRAVVMGAMALFTAVILHNMGKA